MRRRTLLRAAALAPAAALPGCGIDFDSLFDKDAAPIPGKREAVTPPTRGLQVDTAFHTSVNLPSPVTNAEWAQAGGNSAHAMGNLELGDLSRSWRQSIGMGGGYRRKITATPVIAAGRVIAMDSDATVSAFNAATGIRQWRTSTKPKKDRSSNLGGGVVAGGGSVFASTGRAEVLALQAATGDITWRVPLDAPARAAPTLVENRLFLPTLDERMVALSSTDGKRLWSYQATPSATIMLGEPSPAYADGTLVCGFGSGDLVALRSETGTLIWSDSLAGARGRNSAADLSAIRALPVIVQSTVYAIGVGGLMVALDLRSGRRLWEREVAGQHTPWIAGDWVFVLSEDQMLACINRIDGRVRWLTQLPRYGNEKKLRDPIYWTGPLLGGKYLYCAGSTKRLIAINPANGAILGEQDLPDEVSVNLVAAAGKLFVVTEDSTLSALG